MLIKYCTEKIQWNYNGFLSVAGINKSVAFDKVHETLIGLDASPDGYVGFERLQISTNGVVESSL